MSLLIFAYLAVILLISVPGAAFYQAEVYNLLPPATAHWCGERALKTGQVIDL